jgi:hypothetical protein
MQVYDTNNKGNYKNFQNTFFFLFMIIDSIINTILAI